MMFRKTHDCLSKRYPDLAGAFVGDLIMGLVQPRGVRVVAQVLQALLGFALLVVRLPRICRN